MARTYQISVTTDIKTGEVTSYTVTDALTDEELELRPKIAIFPISLLCDEHTQSKRAHKFADYLNSIVEITNDLEKDQKI